jgi:hypothetical protein
LVFKQSATGYRTEEGIILNGLSAVKKSYGPPATSKMHSHLVEPARVLTLSGCIQKRVVPFELFAFWRKGLILNGLSAVKKSYGPPAASKMHSHLVGPARVPTLSGHIQKRPLKKGPFLYGGGIDRHTIFLSCPIYF